jgi:hypothetical protein
VAKNVLLQFLRRKNRQVDTVEFDMVAREGGNLDADPLLPVQFLEWMAFLETDDTSATRNADGSIKAYNGYTEITTASNERQLRFALRLSF